MSSAGDVNGDGIDDLIVGAAGGDDGGFNAGEAYVIYGQAGATRVTLDLSTLTAAQGFIIQGDAAGDLAGRSVAGAGDVNGDGIDDLIVGAPFGDDGGTDAGEAYVIYGQAGATRGRVDLTSLTPGEGFIIQGGASQDYAAFSVSSAGDVNGDGIDDLIVGARYGDDGGTDAGEAYVIYGRRPTLAVERTGTDIGQTIFGGHLDDTLNGMGGNDRLDGGAGADTLIGGAGTDTADYRHASAGVVANLATGGTGGEADGDTYTSIERLLGSDFADSLTGDNTANVLTGGAGDDTLSGGGGRDVLRGGAGADSFVFNTATGSGNVGVIADFSLADDVIALDSAIFTALAVGTPLDALAFLANDTGRAATADQHILYETDTGRLFYDADGNGAGGRHLFATVAPGLALGHTDFLVF